MFLQNKTIWNSPKLQLYLLISSEFFSEFFIEECDSTFEALMVAALERGDEPRNLKDSGGLKCVVGSDVS